MASSGEVVPKGPLSVSRASILRGLRYMDPPRWTCSELDGGEAGLDLGFKRQSDFFCSLVSEVLKKPTETTLQRA
jgi:hypothetical protein